MRLIIKNATFLIVSSFLISTAILVNTAFSLEMGKYNISNKSKIWIEGTSNVSDYSCFTTQVNGQAVLDSVHGMAKIDSWKNQGTKYFADANFKIRAKSLDCGKEMMNEDLYEALKTDQFIYITFILEKAKLLSYDANRKISKILVFGDLSVAGVSKNIELTVTISPHNSGHQYRVQSSIQIDMTDFDIEPPTAFLGLIQADDKLTLFLDLYAIPDQFASGAD